MRLTSRLARSSAWPGSVSNPIAGLFALGEPGVWLDPSDLTTMFQDRAGTTPVTAPGQSVGLRLDKSKGLVLGPELVGTPTLGSGWVSNGNGSWSITNAASSADFRLDFSAIAGKNMRVQYTISGTPLSSGIYTLNTSPIPVSVGSFNLLTVPNATFFIVRALTGASLTISNISVRELPGNHAVANSDAARGIYGIEPVGGRRNLLTYTENFANAAWTKSQATASAGAGIAPNGEATANLIAQSAVTSEHYVEQTVVPTAGSYTASYYVKAGTVASFQIMVVHVNQIPTTSTATFAVTSGVITNTAIAGIITAASATDVGNGWYRCGVSYTLLAGVTSHRTRIYVGLSGIYAGNTSNNLLIWGAQLETGSTATAYQRVTTQYEVTEAGKQTLHYVQYDGVDDGYVTPTITPGTDKAQVFAGVTRGGTTAASLVELGDQNTGNSLAVLAPSSGNTVHFSSHGPGGTVYELYNFTDNTAPSTSVWSGLFDRAGGAGSEITARRNGVVGGTNTRADNTTGNFLAYPLYIGRRGGTSLPFNGRDYGIITRFGPNLNAGTISKMERLLARKTGVTL